MAGWLLATKHRIHGLMASAATGMCVLTNHGEGQDISSKVAIACTHADWYVCVFLSLPSAVPWGMHPSTGKPMQLTRSSSISNLFPVMSLMDHSGNNDSDAMPRELLRDMLRVSGPAGLTGETSAREAGGGGGGAGGVMTRWL